MKEKLLKLLENSQSLYYHYPVACILECKDKTEISGVNVETSSPGAGICAERNALFSSISMGYQKEDYEALHLMAKTNEEIYPCFICRQALIDYCNSDLKIYIYTKDNVVTTTIKALTPKTFSSEDLS